MKLNEIIKNLKIKQSINFINYDILDIYENTLNITSNSLFVCINGYNQDGHNYAINAIEKGACCLVCEKILPINCTQIIVENAKEALSTLIDNFFGAILSSYKFIGVVGTNGKTTTCHLISAILKQSNKKNCVIGTLGIYLDDKVVEQNLTTPSKLSLFKLLNSVKSEGVEYIIMEVSAHAIHQNRLGYVYYEALIFTNCTQDHLDYFKDMQYYKQIKKSIFSPQYCKYMIINSDDPLGQEIINENTFAISYGNENPADVFAINIEENKNGLSFIINLYDAIFHVNTCLYGKYNVSNILSATALCALLEVKIYNISLALNNFKGVTGRLEPINLSNNKMVFIDYAHTPDGLEKSITAVKNISNGSTFTLFGCGGNREKEKREIMGEISGKLSDLTIITSDNPRYEDSNSIICEIEKGVRKYSKNYITINDRKQAIEYALSVLPKDGKLIIAGKGGEKYQEIMGVRHDFCDKKVVMSILNRGS